MFNETPNLASTDLSKSSTAIVQQPHPLGAVLQTLLEDLQNVRRTYFQVLPKTIEWLGEEGTRAYERYERFKEYAIEGGGFELSSAHDVVDLMAAITDIESLRPRQTIETLQKALFTQIFSQFDSFIGALLTAIYTNKTELLKGISREITLSELLEFESLDAVKLNMLEKEIETFRRDSYVEQFATLERKFGFKTLRDFPEWGEFIELAQRRNLMTHNGGRVSEQYLVVCDRESHQFKNRPLIGDELKADSGYFGRAIIVVSKVAFMLVHTLWRKVFPNEWERQYHEMNHTIYSVLADERWKTAAEIAAFSLTEPMRKGVPDLQLRIRIVNYAIALKFSGRTEEVTKLLDSQDWSASYRDFKLAIAVLKDDFQSAGQIMKAIGKAGELVEQVAYHRWPLFHKFRESEIFQATYEEIYCESFARKIVKDASGTSASAPAIKEAPDVSDVLEKRPRRRRETKPKNLSPKTKPNRSDVTETPLRRRKK